MFRRMLGSLMKDPHFDADLSKLGYFLNDEDKVRKVSRPDQLFQYKITNDERHNDLHREALHTVLKEEVDSRMSSLGYEKFFIPQCSLDKPEAPHIPILITKLSDLHAKKRIIIVVNDDAQDLGIWSWRDISGNSDTGLETGSCISFAREIKKRSNGIADNEPGLIIMNPGQLLYSWNENRSMSFRSWQNLPKQSLAHPSVYLHPQHNFVAEHRDANEHVEWTLRELLGTDRIRDNADIYFIAIGNGASALRAVVRNNHDLLAKRIAAVQFVAPWFADNNIEVGSIGQLCQHRFRTLDWSRAPAGVPIAAPYHEHEPDEDGYVRPPSPFLTISTGALEGAEHNDNVFPRVFPRVLDWFEEVAAALSKGGDYVNPHYTIIDPPKLVAIKPSTPTSITDTIGGDAQQDSVDSEKDATTIMYDAREGLVSTNKDTTPIANSQSDVSKDGEVDLDISPLKLEDQQAAPGDKAAVAGVMIDKALLEKAGLA